MKQYRDNETIVRFLQKNFVQILSLLMLALAAYITNRLAPIAQDIAVLKTQVQAVEIINSSQVSSKEFEIIAKRLETISGRVDQIYEKTK